MTPRERRQDRANVRLNTLRRARVVTAGTAALRRERDISRFGTLMLQEVRHQRVTQQLGAEADPTRHLRLVIILIFLDI